MRGFQVVLCAVAIGLARATPSFVHASYSAPAAAVVTGPVSLASQYHAQDALGQYSYGYSAGPSSKAETKTADGVTRGGYSYVDANGIVQTVNYVSDPVNGFRVAATNLPVHAPAPVHDTPEVSAAKAAHAVAYNAAASAAAAAPDVSDSVAVAAAVPAVYTASVPAVVSGHTYTAPGIVSSSNGAGGFAYSTTSVAPVYAPHYYSAVLPASTAPAAYAAAVVPGVVSGHTYTAPGIVASANTAGSFAYSTHAVAPTYASSFYSAVLPASVFPGTVLVNGVPADTPEVAAAKAAHFAAHYQEKLRHLGWAV
ncbi:cuticle protein 19.8-like [Periplaneta americana]|uniref:cuticle protein 19.8-like n=1 Tax=Periplaneta americana TaxID=6978 RepID=UPI0037E9808A